jgi:AraC family transcriptional regulator, transcriptional activator of pobA
MVKQPQRMTIERMRALVNDRQNGDNDHILLGKDLSMILNVRQALQSVLQVNTPFSIDDYRFGMVTKGEMHSVFNLKEYHLEAGHIIFITPGSLAQPIYISDDLELRGMAVSSEWIHLALHEQLPHILNGQLKSGVMHIGGDEMELLKSMFQLLMTVQKQSNGHNEVALNIVAAIVHKYDQWLAREQNDKGRNLLNEQTILDRFIYLVNNNCHEHHHIDFYASRLCLTERYLGTVVRQASGVTAKEWIDRAVITAAKVMLRHSNKQVVEISDELHFPSQSFFCKYFRRLTGTTPQQYREQA